jgi:hypothetical protein
MDWQRKEARSEQGRKHTAPVTNEAISSLDTPGKNKEDSEVPPYTTGAIYSNRPAQPPIGKHRQTSIQHEYMR